MKHRVKHDWLKIYFRASVVILFSGIAFAYGVGVGLFGIFPYAVLESSAGAVRDFAKYPRHYLRMRPGKWLKDAPPGASTEVTSEPAAYDGVTFIDGLLGQSPGMRLLDMDGSVIHEWPVSFSEIFPDPVHIESALHDWDAQIHGAMLYPNGDVVFNFQYAGLVRMDQCSNVKWRVARQTHHSIYEDAEHNLWVPSRRLREEAIDGLPGVPLPFYEEFILLVSPQGEILREISILESIISSGRQDLLFANGAHNSTLEPPLDGDFTHLNDVEILEGRDAAAFPQFDAGDILVSLRNLNLILVLDAETADVKWSNVGPYLRQHDPDFLSDGTISVFDNRRDNAGGQRFGGSRVVVIDPESRNAEVRFGGQEPQVFYTETMGDHQYLPNGNLLVTESNAGHAFEITPADEVVWSFYDFWDEESVAVIGRALRYPRSYSSFIDAGGCERSDDPR